MKFQYILILKEIIDIGTIGKGMFQILNASGFMKISQSSKDFSA